MKHYLCLPIQEEFDLLMVYLIPRPIGPVSYTHLDVYKRQVVDLIPDGENHYLRCAGGAPANVAVGVARLGSPSAFIGRVDVYKRQT